MTTDPTGGFTGGTTLLKEVVITASRLPSIGQTIAGSLARGLVSTAITSAFSPPHDYIRNADGSLKLERLTNDDFDRVKELDGEVTTYLRPVEVRSTMLDGGPLGQAVRNGRANVVKFPFRLARFYYQFAGGAKDFVTAYNEMRDANWVGSDKYFHSKANFDATMRGDGGQFAAEKMSNLRESFDMGIKGDKLEWSLQDQAANRYGRMRARQYRVHGGAVNYQDALPKYRPVNLPSKY
jgi:serum amyloid A protein